MQPETLVVKKIRAALEARGALVVKIHGSQYMPEGFPDLIVVLPPRLRWLDAGSPAGWLPGESVFIEVKTPGRSDGPWACGVSLMQLRWLWKLGAQGARCTIAESAAEAVAFCFPA